MKSFKILIYLALSLVAVAEISAQRAWSVPATVTDPSASVTIYVDINGAHNGPGVGCTNLLGTTETLYIWAWGASGRPGGDWNNYIPDPALAWTKETSMGTDVYSFTMIPSQFYGATDAQVYTNDINFLIREIVPGSGGCAGGERKTGDMKILVDPPYVPVLKVRSFPKPLNAYNDVPFNKEDAFTLVYDANMEQEQRLIGQSDFFVYPILKTVSGQTIRYPGVNSPGSAQNYPELQMAQNSDGTFTWSVFPDTFFNIPAGEELSEIKFKIIKRGASVAQDQVAIDGVYDFTFKVSCP